MAPATPTHPTPFPSLSGYEIVEQLYAGSRTRVYRAVEESSQRPVVLKFLQQEYPTFDDLLHFRNQYTIAKALNLPGVIRPYSLEAYGNSYVLVMEDIGGLSLHDYARQSALSVCEVLTIAIQLTEILHDLHQQRVIYKDLKPANILIQPTSKQVKLIDFSIASLLPRETQEIQNPNSLEGTLAYLSPEQTGRMNRGIDYRSDFYTFGATLYELLTGQLPFQSDDPMELVYSHLAKVPSAPHELNPEIPITVSEIVLKLMAKNAEDRYQSALGLKYDLETCLHQLKEIGTVIPFEIGTRDLSDRFTIPEKLYGREAEVQDLLDAFDRVAQGQTELMLVAGFSGIGKTAVINEVHKPIVRQRGYFIKGKFDQFNRNIPFSAFVQAFRDLMAQLLSESDEQLHTWKSRILKALGENAQVIIEVIPELERILGVQPPAPELSGTAAQNRFNLLFQKFIQVFSTSEHPLVMFLDDLQWADSASLNFVKLLMSQASSGYLLILGAYRDNEVFTAHPLMLTLEEIQKAQATINKIILAPLREMTVNLLVADTLSCTDDLARPLTQLIYQKTQGNPFFTTQFLKALYEEGWITFQANLGYWQCDLASMRQLTLTDDVVEFMAQQLQKLPVETQTVLKFAACIGNQFDLKTLAIVAEQSSIETASQLWKALQEGLILPINETYKFFQSQDRDTQENEVIVIYKFLHDRVQQAAYSLIAAGQQQSTHLKMGQLLLQNSSQQEREDRLFEIANHLNVGIPLITHLPEREKLAELNVAAGRKAKTSTAYGASIAYLRIGIELLPEAAWESHYPLMLALHEEIAEASYLNTDFEQMEQWAGIVLHHARTLLDTIKVQQIRIMGAKVQGQFLDSIAVGLQVLKELGIEFPAQPTQADIGQAFGVTRSLWADQAPQRLLELPAMTDSHRLATMEILTVLVSAAYMAAPNLMPLLIFKQVELSIQFGNSPVSIFTYADYGLILSCVIGDIDNGYEFGELALSLLEQLQAKPFKSRSWYVVHTYIKHWKTHLSNMLPPLQEAYQSGLETGDIESLSLNATAYCYYAYHAGQDLVDLAPTLEAYRQTIARYKQTFSLPYQEIYQQTVLNLLGQTAVPYRLTGEIFHHDQCLPQLKAMNHRAALFIWHINQTILYYLFEKNREAIETSAQTAQYLDGGLGTFMVPLYSWFEALIQLAQVSEVADEERQTILLKVQEHQDQLHHWATLAPMNHQHRWELVEAERCRVLGDKTNAIEAYDRAIAIAKENRFIQDEALSNELAAKFYLHWGKAKIAASYIQQAYYCYSRWGAKAKTADLETRYPDLLHPILQPVSPVFNVLETLAPIALPLSIHPATSSNHSSEMSVNLTLDFNAILRTSQSLSGTIQLDDLLHQLTQVILQYSGSDLCAVLLPDQAGDWIVKAIATADATALRTEPLADHAHLPIKLIQYVKRTQDMVLIDNCDTELPVIDEYLSKHQPKSVLCVPILNRGNLISMVYLENRSTSGVFTRDRLLLLNFLCTQAAISLENARLYQASQVYGQQLEQSLEQLKVSETRFQKLADNIPGLIYQIRIQPDGTSSIPYVSSGCQTLYEVAAEDLMSGKYSLREFEHPDDQEGVFQAVLASAQNLTPFRHEWRIITPTGAMKWVQAISQPERREDGEVVWDGIVIDISDRKKVEAEQARLLAILESTSDFIGTADPEGRILYVNRAWRNLLHLDRTETNIADHHPAWAIEIIANQALPEAVRSGMWIGETAVLDKTGQEIPISQVVLAHKSSHGEVEYFSTMARDISDRKRAENAVLQKSQELEQALAKLQNAQLQMVQSEKMASLGNLVAGVAHEINNPIGFLNGSIRNASDYVQDVFGHLALYQQHYSDPAAPIQDNAEDIDLKFIYEDLPKVLNSMRGAVDRIKSISNSLRTFSRADTEHKVCADLHEGIDSTLLILKYRLKANDARPAIQVIQEYGTLPAVECFPGQLNQVFMNILANAIDMFDEMAQGFSYAELEANPQRIEIQTAIVGNHVEIRIRDNGKGMSEVVKERIFDHLFTTKGVGKGTGLGLAIARQIVEEKHGGQILVNSSLGAGTEFLIQLPA
ncbi:ATP-binding sensor histidine kinase [Leptolyngbya sp. GGD]|uniref:ATP-binding sensor histidine kinase n=1 Tax=Leptolyngbya sp. GGD TaxID=2997907 RepID=UPI00227B6513|nr:AAA family ATPase [Leptolyngbya sp. GGD]MCY6490463.1 AAA family ATPase [Leptolyngbya sp. GGD]